MPRCKAASGKAQTPASKVVLGKPRMPGFRVVLDKVLLLGPVAVLVSQTLVHKEDSDEPLTSAHKALQVRVLLVGATLARVDLSRS